MTCEKNKKVGDSQDLIADQRRNMQEKNDKC